MVNSATFSLMREYVHGRRAHARGHLNGRFLFSPLPPLSLSLSLSSDCNCQSYLIECILRRFIAREFSRYFRYCIVRVRACAHNKIFRGTIGTNSTSICIIYREFYLTGLRKSIVLSLDKFGTTRELQFLFVYRAYRFLGTHNDTQRDNASDQKQCCRNHSNHRNRN